MKRWLALFLCVIMLVPVPALAGTTGTVDEARGGREAGPVQGGDVRIEARHIEFSRPMMSERSAGNVDDLAIPGLPMLNRPGLPRVPVRTVAIELPAGSRVLDIVVGTGAATDVALPGSPPLTPAVHPIGPAGIMGDVEISMYYDGSRFPADDMAYDLGRGLGRDGEPALFVNVYLYPVSVESGVAQEDGYTVTYLDSMDLEVRYLGPAEERARDEGPGSRDGGEFDLVIVAPGTFEDELEGLARHKRATGLGTIIVTIDEIYDGTHFEVEGRDGPERIKHFIKDAVEEWGTRYVLLGGDVDQVPTRHAMIEDGYDDDGSMYADGAWVATDTYYGDLYDENGGFSSWDESDNDVFGEWTGGSSGHMVDDPDFYLDVFVGRLPASSSTEMNNLVDKILIYENGTDWSFFFNAGLAGVDTWVNDGSGVAEGEHGMDAIGDILGPEGFSPTKLYMTQGTLSPSAVNDAVNDGVGVMSFSGHGTFTAWGSETTLYYSIGHLSGMMNGAKLPVGSQAACLTGAFDNEDGAHYPGWSTPDSMAEEFVLLDSGGFITDMGSSRVSFGATGPYWDEYATGYLNKRYYKALATKHVVAGEMFSTARDDYLTNQGIQFAGDFKHMAAFNLLGDPSLAIGGIGAGIEVREELPAIAPGKSADVNVTLRNTGAWSGEFRLEGHPETPGWSTDIGTPNVTLDMGAERNVTVTITAADRALAGSTGRISLEAVSRLNNRSVTTEIGLGVKRVYGLELEADAGSREGLPGEDVTFNLTVSNTGNGPDGASVTATDTPVGWGVYLPEEHVDLDGYGSAASTVTLSLPREVLAGTYWFNVTAQLDGADISRTRELRVDVRAVHDVGIQCVECGLQGDPGGAVTAVLELSNLGNVVEDMALNLTVPGDWGPVSGGGIHRIGAFSSKEVALEIAIYEKALADTYTIPVRLSIAQDTDSVDLEVRVNRTYGLDVTPDEEGRTVEGGQEVAFGARVRNTGNGPERVDISPETVPDGWMAQGDPRGFTVEAYSIYRVQFFVATCFDSLAGPHTVVMVAEGASGNASDTVDLTVEVLPRPDGTASLALRDLSLGPGVSNDNPVTFENRGNINESVMLARGWNGSPPAGMEVIFPDRAVPVEAGGSGVIPMTITVPPDALAGKYEYSVLVERDRGPTLALNGTLRVLQVFGHGVSADRDGGEVAAGETLTKRLEVHNTGNGHDTYTMRVSGERSWWSAPSVRTFTLGPGERRVLYLQIAPPREAAAEEQMVYVEAVSEKGGAEGVLLNYSITRQGQGTTSVESGRWSITPLLLIIVVVAAILAGGAMERRRSTGPSRDREEYVRRGHGETGHPGEGHRHRHGYRYR